MIDRPRITTYLPKVDSPIEHKLSDTPVPETEPQAVHAVRVRLRGLPSPAEQARRKAKMKALGDKTGRLIREAIARSER